MQQQQRWSRKVVSAPKSKNIGRKHKLPQSIIEDTVSSLMVEKYHGKIVNFADKLTRALENKGTVYAHGGYALFAAAKSKPEEVASMAQRFKDVLEPVMKMPRDIDLTVFPYNPIACNAFRSCMENGIVSSVTAGLRDLRREIHNDISGDTASMDELMLQAVEDANRELPTNKGLKILDMWIADTSHRHIEPYNKGQKNAIVDRHNFRQRMNRCTNENMMMLDAQQVTARPRSRTAASAVGSARKGQCFPLRDHLNATIEFSSKLNDAVTVTSDFVLCRLALGVGVTFTTGESNVPKTIEVPVNFVDVSITRKNDSRYKSGGSQTPQVFKAPGFLPYPSLEYIAHNNYVQHAWNNSLLGRSALDDDTRVHTQKTVKKLENRMTAIKLLQSIPVKGAAPETSSSKPSSGGDDDDPPGALKALTRAMRWLSSSEQAGVHEYIKSQMRGQRSRSPSGQGVKTTANKTQVFGSRPNSGSKPKTPPKTFGQKMPTVKMFPSVIGEPPYAFKNSRAYAFKNSRGPIAAAA